MHGKMPSQALLRWDNIPLTKLANYGLPEGQIFCGSAKHSRTAPILRSTGDGGCTSTLILGKQLCQTASQ
jgi:hypothetical protein